MPLFLKILQVVLLSTVKFFFAPPLAIGLGFNYWQTIVLTTSGGLLGMFVFYYLSTAILRLYRYILRKIRKGLNIKEPAHNSTIGKRKKQFTRRNKFLVRLRGKYGMIGIIILTPCLISIPIGCFLLNKYYSANRLVLLYMALSIMAWSSILSSLFFFSLI